MKEKGGERVKRSGEKIAKSVQLEYKLIEGIDEEMKLSQESRDGVEERDGVKVEDGDKGSKRSVGVGGMRRRVGRGRGKGQEERGGGEGVHERRLDRKKREEEERIRKDEIGGKM